MYYFGIMLNTACLYMTAGAGSAICIKSGDFNLGGEGQIYAGGFMTAMFLYWFKNLWAPFALPAAFIAAAVTGAALSLISSALKKYKNASYLLTSFILSSAIIPLIDGLITGPCRNKTGNLIATPFLEKKFCFYSFLPPSPFNGYCFAAILICILAGLFIYKTNLGKNICIYGISPEFSKYSGNSETTLSFTASGISGALHGITGAAAVCGTYYTCHTGFYSGIGWNALAIAMLARANPYAVIPASFLVSVIMTYANKHALYHNFDFDISGIIQGLILFIIAMPIIRRPKCSK